MTDKAQDKRREILNILEQKIHIATLSNMCSGGSKLYGEKAIKHIDQALTELDKCYADDDALTVAYMKGVEDGKGKRLTVEEVERHIEKNFHDLFYDLMMFRDGLPSEGIIAKRVAQAICEAQEEGGGE